MSAARGQEFICDVGNREDALDWLSKITSAIDREKSSD
jgi:hypothetical protein